jgi:hypothetical protein
VPEPTKKGILIIERMLKVDKVKEEDEVLQGIRPPPRVLIHKSAAAKVEILPIAWSEPMALKAMKFQQEMKLLQDRVFAAMYGVPLKETDDGPTHCD